MHAAVLHRGLSPLSRSVALGVWQHRACGARMLRRPAIGRGDVGIRWARQHSPSLIRTHGDELQAIGCDWARSQDLCSAVLRLAGVEFAKFELRAAMPEAQACSGACQRSVGSRLFMIRAARRSRRPVPHAAEGSIMSARRPSDETVYVAHIALMCSSGC